MEAVQIKKAWATVKFHAKIGFIGLCMAQRLQG